MTPLIARPLTRAEREAATARERTWRAMHRFNVEVCEVCQTGVVGALPGYPARHYPCESGKVRR